MIPPIFPVCAASPAVRTALGSSPVRLFPFGLVDPAAPPATPYAVWQDVGGSPSNYLGGLPDVDSFTLQVDVYGSTDDEARDGALALRDAIEPRAHIVQWRGQELDPETKKYRYSFDVDWIVPR